MHSLVVQLRTHATSVKESEQVNPVCRPNEFKIHRAQRPHFKFTESQRPASTHFKFSNQIKSATSRIMCRSFLFLFGFQLSLI